MIVWEQVRLCIKVIVERKVFIRRIVDVRITMKGFVERIIVVTEILVLWNVIRLVWIILGIVLWLEI